MMMNKSISKLQKEIHQFTRSKGFYETTDAILENLSGKLDAKNINLEFDLTAHGILLNLEIVKRLMLVNTEISEAVESLREITPNPSNFKEEIADAVIRLFDICEWLNIDLEAEIDKKMKYNNTRPYLHSKRF
jgi:NTP pyrophosphatase (non-canonical NTP hydrolase)